LLAFERLLTIMDELRAQCPWDKKQTFETLRHLTIEEVYELGDAILKNDLNEVKNELGDLFLHLVFYAKLGSETGIFDVTDVLHGVCDKLVRRHPHIYGNVQADTEEAVKQNWEKIKLAEKTNENANENLPKSVLGGVPTGLPAIVKAARIQEKAQGVGFDWNNANEVWAKVQEELNELQQAVITQNAQDTEGEMGDVLFALINYARFIKINPDSALERTNQKFIKRFQYIERQAHAQGRQITDMTIDEMEYFWQAAKHEKL
jgi:XTP/dITP diphosphohydrolase